MLSLCLNMCLCYDLVQTMWSPFTPASSRSKFYYIFSFSGAILTVIIIALGNAKFANTNNLKDSCDSCLFEYAQIEPTG